MDETDEGVFWLPAEKKKEPLRYDDIYKTSRASLYSHMARNLHPPRCRPQSTRRDFMTHYDDLARINRNQHNLNWPRPKMSTEERTYWKSVSKTEAVAKSGRAKVVQTSNEVRETRREILEHAAAGRMFDQELLIAALSRDLIQAGVSLDDIKDAFENVTFRYIVTRSPAEIEICLIL
jgi:hypothetical protein